MPSREAWVLTLGNEVVQGRVVNTNAAYLGRRLFILGLDILGNISLVDDVGLVSTFLKELLGREPKLIVTSGGLGPTYDDRTLEAVARATGRPLKLNEDALRMVEEWDREGGYELTEERVKMAYLPEGAVPISNPVGSAPGSWLEVGETIVISLPGVPKELEAMWEGWVEPRIREVIPTRYVVEKTFRVVGVPESSAARIVKKVLRIYDSVYIKTHPKGDEVRKPVLDVYVLASGSNRLEAEELVAEVTGELKEGLRELGGVIKEAE
ncbi:MAG: nicotinamide mononucleotide deamidase-related protein [Desulfurococcales archaeon]|nr:nicotinamide mononucleotide deamidase-related protein [Desulfurococcales archaeon]